MEVYKRGSAVVFKSAGKRIDETGSAVSHMRASLAVPRGGRCPRIEFKREPIVLRGLDPKAIAPLFQLGVRLALS